MRETAPLIRDAAYSAAMISGGLYGASLGSVAGGIGAGPGAVLGVAGGWATAKVSERAFGYAHHQANKFNVYAEHIGRDDLERLRNQRTAQATTGALMAGLEVASMARGGKVPGVKKSTTGPTGNTYHSRSGVVFTTAHARSHAPGRMSAEEFIKQTVPEALQGGNATGKATLGHTLDGRREGKGKRKVDAPYTKNASDIRQEGNTNLRVPGRAQSRINIIQGNNKPDIRDPKNTKPGIETVWPKHMNPERPNKSQFTISKEEVLSILQDKKTVQTPITLIVRDGHRYVREVEVRKPIGRLPERVNSKETSTITILTDKEGNLVDCYPGEFRYERA